MYEKEKSEIQNLKSYLLHTLPTTPLPPNNVLLSSNSVALKAAIAGLDKELTRLEREERLVKKFTAGNDAAVASGAGVAAAAGAAAAGNNEDIMADMEYVRKEDATADDDDVAMGEMKEKTASTATLMNDHDEEEWEDAKKLDRLAARLDNSQELPAESEEAANEETKSICQNLASSSIARIAKSNVRTKSPLGALGLALHAALLQLAPVDDEKESIFKCTGVPDDNVTCQLLGVDPKKKKGGGGGGGGGFAPPIRELPRGQLVPSNWEGGSSDRIAFRYKCGNEMYSTKCTSGTKNDASTVYLALQLLVEDDEEVMVTFGTLPSSKESNAANQTMKFPLGRHVNLDGFSTAKAKGGGGGLVSPSLFYVSLSDLLTKFCTVFEVLPKKTPSVSEEAAMGTAMGVASMDVAAAFSSAPSKLPGFADASPKVVPPVATGRPIIATGNNNNNSSSSDDNTDPLRIMSSRPQQPRKRHGDFDGDLHPGGPMPGGLDGGRGHGGLHPVPPHGGGSQVGPNHPMFDRTFGDEGGYYGGVGSDDLGYGAGGGSFGIPGVGGMGMRPRFDPYGPPGGPTQPGRGGGPFPGRGSRLGGGRGRGGRGGGRVPPGGFGNPNPDHMTPPGGDYFS
mmetsp:Transcript_4166/g.7753  ORF Transcript_4166/g.7753 Transcript_4166/m.7753 type:complete len:623 (-) Transcript_4166:286-2154(-)